MLGRTSHCCVYACMMLRQSLNPNFLLTALIYRGQSLDIWAASPEWPRVGRRGFISLLLPRSFIPRGTQKHLTRQWNSSAARWGLEQPGWLCFKGKILKLEVKKKKREKSALLSGFDAAAASCLEPGCCASLLGCSWVGHDADSHPFWKLNLFPSVVLGWQPCCLLAKGLLTVQVIVGWGQNLWDQWERALVAFALGPKGRSFSPRRHDKKLKPSECSRVLKWAEGSSVSPWTRVQIPITISWFWGWSPCWWNEWRKMWAITGDGRALLSRQGLSGVSGLRSRN